MAALDLSVVIVNYNTMGYTRRCLASLSDGARGLAWEAVVVDNASSEPGAEALAREFPNVRVLRRARNGGFAAGANTGIRAARADVLFLLNPDTRVMPGAAAALLQYLRAHPDVGIVAPKLVNPDGSLQLSCRRFPTLWTGVFNRYSLLTRLVPRNRFSTAYLMSDWDHASTREVDWVSGAAMMITRAALTRVGGFDEGYFFAMEDVDLCRRMHEAGLRVVYLPDAVVEHCIGGSASTAPARALIARHRGMWRYYRRWTHWQRPASPRVVRCTLAS
ncbi:MAG: hypothetical protein C4290_09975 [Chloroflexota bacterium]